MSSAAEILELAMLDPRATLAATSGAESGASGLVDVISLSATAIAHAVLGESGLAKAELAQASGLVVGREDAQAAALVAAVQGVVRHMEGQDVEALGSLNVAMPQLNGSELAWALGQRSEIQYRLGNFDASEADSDASLSLTDQSSRPLSNSRAALTRAALHVHSGDPASARKRLEVLRDSLLDQSHDRSAARALVALARLEHRSGNRDKALNILDDAEELLGDLGHSVGDVWRQRAALLMASHLHADAEHAAGTAHSGPQQAPSVQGRLDSLLISAQAAFLSGKNEHAEGLAKGAAEVAGRYGRPGWESFAQYLVVRARDAAGVLAEDDLAASDLLAQDLDTAGLHVEAIRTRLIGSSLATRLGDRQGSLSRLRAAAESRTSGRFEASILGWLATCLLRLDRGDTRGAAAAARAGTRRVEHYAAAYGSLEGLHIKDAATRLGNLGLQLAWSSNSPRRLFAWIELTRRGYRTARAQGRVANDEIKIGRIMLRQANDELRYALLEGRERRHQEVRRNLLQRELAALAISELKASDDVPPVAAVLEQLGDGSLVEFAEMGDSLIAVLLSSGRVRKFDLGSAARIRDRVDAVTVEMRRVSQRVGSAASRAAALETVAVAVRELEEAIFGQMTFEPGHLVVVPAGPTFAVPWSLLPALRASRVEVVPSAAMWLERAVTPLPPLNDATAIAGPRLQHSRDEIARVAAVYPRTTELVEPTAADAVRAIDGVAVAHIACHGNLRIDNPLFSSLEMVDGPLSVYNLEALEQAPQIMVLSACDAGANTSTGGHEVMGLATALLGQGTRSVIANVGLVPDQLATIDLMVEVHRGLRDGASVSAALAQALPPLDYTDPDVIAARAFVTFGA